ncbi:MAG TPA: MFS transporter [Mycobacteriales bacterium]|nr:MFS transporter [Mycobacteriales bacterium]
MTAPIPVCAAPVDTRIDRRDPAFRRVAVAMFASGAAVFALLYAPQAVLPHLSAAFRITPAGAALSMSVATAALALAVIPVSALSERWGRVRVMTVSVVAVTVLALLVPLSPSYPALLALRALQGIAIAGLPAVSMAYLADEVHPRSLGGAVGVLIAGHSLGGLAGRLLTGLATDLGGWRAGLGAVALLAAGCGVAFVVLLPPQRHFRPAPVSVRHLVRSVRGHLGDPALRRLYLAGFLLMGGFVTLYNYLGFRLLRAPFELPTAVVGLVFLAYLGGTVSSTVAGRLADRHGARRVFGVSTALAVVAALLTLPDALPAVLAGVLLLTAGFFGAHSVASGWIGRLAHTDRAQASGLYLFAYYAGSSVGGWFGGVVFGHAGWHGTVVYLVLVFTVTLGAVTFRRPTS